jgi:hypothetical protein
LAARGLQSRCSFLIGRLGGIGCFRARCSSVSASSS